jgi:hypothetical protein
MTPVSVWWLRLDLLWVLFLLRVFTAGREGEIKPEVHLFLGDRYWRLADYYAEKGSVRKAVRLRARANSHLGLGHWNPPLPPAMAMAVPRRPTFTEAIGWGTSGRPPDDAA